MGRYLSDHYRGLSKKKKRLERNASPFSAFPMRSLLRQETSYTVLYPCGFTLAQLCIHVFHSEAAGRVLLT